MTFIVLTCISSLRISLLLLGAVYNSIISAPLCQIMKITQHSPHNLKKERKKKKLHLTVTFRVGAKRPREVDYLAEGAGCGQDAVDHDDRDGHKRQ